jgi:hypothetical protein
MVIDLGSDLMPPVAASNRSSGILGYLGDDHVLIAARVPRTIGWLHLITFRSRADPEGSESPHSQPLMFRIPVSIGLQELSPTKE